MNRWIRPVLFLQLYFCSNAFAARIVGIEANQTSPVDSGYSFMDRVDEAIEPLRSLEYSGSAGFGSSGFQGTIAIGYLMGPYVLIETTSFYAREASGEVRYNLRSGISSDLTLRLGRRNGAIVPFGGTGVGFERWDQYSDQEPEPLNSSRDDSATVSQFAGLSIRISNNLQIKMTSRWLTWLDNPPFDLKTGFKERLSRRERRLDLGFGVIF